MSVYTDGWKILLSLPAKVKNNINIYHSFRNSFGTGILFVTHDDKVFGFGCNRFGRLGFGHETEVKEPKELVTLSGKRVKEFYVGTDFILALTDDLTLYSWGWNKTGQLGRGLTRNGCFEPGVIERFTCISE